MTNTHKKRLIGKDDEMDRDVIGKKIGDFFVVAVASLKTYFLGG